MQYLRLFFSIRPIPLVSQLNPISSNTDLTGVTTIRHLPLSVSLYTDSQLGVFQLSKAPLYLWPRPHYNFWFYISSLSNSAILNFQSVTGHAGIPENKHADSLLKAGASLPTAKVPCPSPRLLPKLVTPSITNRDVTFPHSSSHLNCPVPTVSPLELVLLHPICFELSAFAFNVKASYNYCKPIVRKTLPVVFVDIFYRTLIIFF